MTECLQFCRLETKIQILPTPGFPLQVHVTLREFLQGRSQEAFYGEDLLTPDRWYLWPVTALDPGWGLSDHSPQQPILPHPQEKRKKGLDNGSCLLHLVQF